MHLIWVLLCAYGVPGERAYYAPSNLLIMDVIVCPRLLSISLYLQSSGWLRSKVAGGPNRGPGYARDPLKIGSSVSISFHIHFSTYIYTGPSMMACSILPHTLIHADEVVRVYLRIYPLVNIITDHLGMC